MARSPWRVGTVEQRKTGNKKAPIGCLSAADRRWPALAHGFDHSFRQAHPACADAQGVGQYQQRCVGHGGVDVRVEMWPQVWTCARARSMRAARCRWNGQKRCVQRWGAWMDCRRYRSALPCTPTRHHGAAPSGQSRRPRSPRRCGRCLCRHRRDARITSRCWCSVPTRPRRSGPSRARCPSPRRTGRRPRTRIPCRSSGNGCR